MNKPEAEEANKTVDAIQERLTSYALSLHYENLPPEVIHAAKARIIDTLGALIAGFYGEPCRIARSFAARSSYAGGATIIGTRGKTRPEMAAFVNGTTARYAELNDSYHWPGSAGGHPSDTVLPLLAAAEHAQVSGREFITGIVLGYEVYARISDVLQHRDFDNTNFCCVGTAVAAGVLLGLSFDQLAHCVSMAIVPNIVLTQVRRDHNSMFKAAACGQAGRAGIFAALLARSGMEGPHLPFEGKAGWCKHVAREQFSLDVMGEDGTRFKILDTQIKLRPCEGASIACILAAEKVAPLDINKVERITVEVYQYAKDRAAFGEHHWNPDSREAADHSIPYLVAATLMDGTVTLRSFNDAHLWNPQLRALIHKIEVVANEEFTAAFNRLPQEHRMRVTVVMTTGERHVGETGGDQDDMATPKSDAQIEHKFRRLTEDMLSAKQVDTILDRLWRLHEVRNVAEIPPAFVFD